MECIWCGGKVTQFVCNLGVCDNRVKQEECSCFYGSTCPTNGSHLAEDWEDQA